MESLARVALAEVVEPMEQWPGEILPFAEWLTLRGPMKHVVEIGVRRGGTAALWHGLSTGLVVGVDWDQRDSLGPDETARVASAMRQRCERYRLVIGDSHSPATRAAVTLVLHDEQVDLLFIDGDHSYAGVRADYELYRPLVRPGGIVAFHDIVDSDFMRQVGHGVPQFWRELKATTEHVEFCVGGAWGGIGAVVVP